MLVVKHLLSSPFTDLPYKSDTATEDYEEKLRTEIVLAAEVEKVSLTLSLPDYEPAYTILSSLMEDNLNTDFTLHRGRQSQEQLISLREKLKKDKLSTLQRQIRDGITKVSREKAECVESLLDSTRRALSLKKNKYHT